MDVAPSIQLKTVWPSRAQKAPRTAQVKRALCRTRDPLMIAWKVGKPSVVLISVPGYEPFFIVRPFVSVHVWPYP